MKKLFIVLILLSFFAADLAPALAPPPAEAQIIPVPAANLFVGIVRIIGIFNRRNRVYSEAKLTVEEMNAYYENLLDHMQPTEMGGQYWRTRWQIEQERQAVIAAAEYVKQGARHQFGNEMGQAALDQLAGSNGGVKFLGEIRQTIQATQMAAAQVQAAAATAQQVPEIMVASLNEQLGGLHLSENEIKQLGGGLGQFLNNALGGIPDRFEAGSAQLEADMETTIDMLSEMDAFVGNVQQGGRSPISASTMSGGNVRGSGGMTATLNQTIDSFLGLLVALDETGKPPQFMTDIRNNIREALLAGHLQTLDAAAFGATFAKCEIVDREAYLAAAGQLAMTPEIALDEERVIYKICRDKESGELIYAFMIGPNAPKDETHPVEEGEVGEDELYDETAETTDFDFSACLPPPDEYTIEIVNLSDQSNTKKRSCNADGIITNKSDRRISVNPYRVHNYGGHDYEKWKPYWSIIEPGESFPLFDYHRCTGGNCGDGEWFYYPKVSIIYNTPECLNYIWQFDEPPPESIIEIESACMW
ncbi:MAG: hypothetical protein JXA42_21895 [Anaerolineales bacterium]|nr:hypothetical protein [Anaerolineales bacterium]